VAVGRAVFIARGWLSADSGFTWMPAGMLLTGWGLLYLAVSAALCSDNNVIVMTRRELVKFFYSPIAYIVLVGFTFIGWVLFWLFVSTALWRDPPGTPIPQPEPVVFGYIISWFPIICVIFVVPVLTMGLLSEEHRTGTLEVLLTAPVNEPAVVVSKFLAAFAFYMALWLPWGLFLVALRAEGGQPFDYYPLLGFFIALAFSGAGFLSMGLFFSSLTRNQIIASILTFAGMLALLLLFFFKQRLTPDSVWHNVFTHVSFIDLWINSLEGKLGPRDLLFHLSAAAFWLFLTVKVLESRKWR
jgi:gliding motility-associated transport system permease protein